MKKLSSILFSSFFFYLIMLLSSSSLGQGTINTLDPTIESKINSLLQSMSPEEKVGQTCQITLDAILKADKNGRTLEPLEIDKSKLEEAILHYHVGSILNVSSHTITLKEWECIFDQIQNYYQTKKEKMPILYGIDAIHGVNYTVGGTLFPQEIGLAATWNRSLAEKFAEITAYETRASGIPWNFSPVLDVARQPLWSRYFETLGEDPYLAAELSKAIVSGYQGKDGIDPYHVAACLKHFAGYSMSQSGRDRTPAWIPEKYMQEIFLPSFKAAVERGAMTLMINSGDVNGIPGHMNYHLLTEILKNEWHFNGFTVSDWEDFIMLETVHKTADSEKDGIAKAFNAGVDMSMVPNNPQYKSYCSLMLEALKEGTISEERLNDAVRRILRVKMLVGLFDKNFGQAKKYPDFGSEDFKNSAENAALESITLLKNENGILPLSKNTKLLVSGPTANSLNFLNGAWTHTWQGADTAYNSKDAKTILGALQQSVGNANVTFAKGAEMYYENGWEQCRLTEIEDFKEKAKNADVIVLCLGELPSTEKPGDIHSLDLPHEQIELAKIAYATGKKVIIVLTEARPRILHSIVEGASGIIQTYLPGDYGANALAKILFGDVNPSGKLPYTYPKYNGVIEFYDHPKSVDRSKANDFNAFDPEWEFGYGLSYTQFEYSKLEISSKEVKGADTLVVRVNVTNKGEIAGKEVVQLFLSDNYASMVPAGKRLKGFEKIALQPNETKTVEFTLTKKDLEFSDACGKWIAEPGSFDIRIDNLSTSFDFK